MTTPKSYLYKDLPTPEAKRQARKWWTDLERQDPAWKKEHDESKAAAVELYTSSVPADLPEIIRKSEYAEMTGYCSDCLLADWIKGDRKLPLRAFYNAAWKEELRDRLQDVEHIEETIEANEYRFTVRNVPAKVVVEID